MKRESNRTQTQANEIRNQKPIISKTGKGRKKINKKNMQKTVSKGKIKPNTYSGRWHKKPKNRNRKKGKVEKKNQPKKTVSKGKPKVTLDEDGRRNRREQKR